MTRKVITFDRGRGSRRRLKQIRWEISELFSLGLFTILIVAMGVVILLWELHHQHPYSEPPRDPQIRDAEPKEP